MSVFVTNANRSMRSEESGAVFLVTAPNLVLLLPPTSPDLSYTFVLGVGGLSAGTGLSISPRLNDKIMGNGFAPQDDKDALLAGAGDREGDSITFVGDGIDGWYITAAVGTWSREA